MRALNQSEKPLVSDFCAKEQRLLLLCSRSHGNRESGTNEELVQLWSGSKQRTTITVANNRLVKRTVQSHTGQETENVVQVAKWNGKKLIGFSDQTNANSLKRIKRKIKLAIFFSPKKPGRMTVVHC